MYVYVWSLLIMRLDSNLRFRPLSSEHGLTSWLAWKRIGLALPWLVCVSARFILWNILLSHVSNLPFNVIETCSLDVWPGWKNNGDINQVPRLSEDLIRPAFFKVVHCRSNIIEWDFFWWEIFGSFPGKTSPPPSPFAWEGKNVP